MVAFTVTAAEQYQLELINRARLDPVAEAARLGINVNEGLAPGTISIAAKQPLAGLPASALHDIAVDHTRHMINVDQLRHEGIGDGTPESRIDGKGIVWSSWGENIAATSGTNEALNTTKLYENLFKDVGIAGRGHRLNILDNDFDEAGIGISTGVFNPTGGGSTLVTQDFVGSARTFVTGVAYNDTNNNKFYDIGEARSGVDVVVGYDGIQNDGPPTGGAGGYAVQVTTAATTRTVQFSGGGLAAAVNVTVTGNASENFKVDLVGTNTIYSSANTTLGAGAANLTLLGFNNNTGVGNAAANIINGTRGNNSLFGLEGTDTLNGGDGNDALNGGAGADKLNGGNGDDKLTGAAGADVLNGGNNTDTAVYLGGFAITANLTAPSLNKGDALGDTYISIENLTGSQYGDVLVADAAINFVQGVGGNDTLRGLGGADRLDGGTGNDSLEGGTGSDILIGGDNFDFAVYTNAAARVTANLMISASNTGDAAGDVYQLIEGLGGSKFGDTLIGNLEGNILNGEAGDDRLEGGFGNDILEGGVGKDVLNGGDQFDSATYGLATAPVTANLANSLLNTGEALGDTYISIEGLGGSVFNDKLTGNSIGNIINGGLGNDTLAGGAGADAFLFNSTLNNTTNVDTITDFSVVDDVFWLENTGVFGKLTTPGALNAVNFKIGAAAADSNDFIVYNKATGDIFYDADGNGAGAAIKFAHVNANTALTVADFLII